MDDRDTEPADGTSEVRGRPEQAMAGGAVQRLESLSSRIMKALQPGRPLFVTQATIEGLLGLLHEAVPAVDAWERQRRGDRTQLLYAGLLCRERTGTARERTGGIPTRVRAELATSDGLTVVEVSSPACYLEVGEEYEVQFTPARWPR